MTVKFKYQAFPSNLIERSLSNNPDDISRVNVGISVRNENEAATVDEIRLTLPPELTTNFKMVAPTTNKHGRWRAVKSEEPALISVRPLDDSVSLAKDDSFIIHLNDVEVSTVAGLANIEIQEQPGDGEPFMLELRKIDPFLRIDYFKMADTGFIEEGGKIKINLTWATTAAKSVRIVRDGTAVFEKEGDGNGEDKFEINDTTTVFTLEATGTGSSLGGDNPDIVSQQLVVVRPGPVGIGTARPHENAGLHLKGDLILEPGRSGANRTIFGSTTSSPASGNQRYVKLINSPNQSSAMGLMAGGVLISESYADGNPEKDTLLVKGKIGLGKEAMPPDAGLDVRPVLKASENGEALVGLNIDPTFNDNNRQNIQHFGLTVKNGLSSLQQEAWRNLSGHDDRIFHRLTLDRETHRESGPQYFKDSMGMVHLRGRLGVNQDIEPTGFDFEFPSIKIGVLDPDYRPDMDLYFVTWGRKSGGIFINIRIFVSFSGNLEAEPDKGTSWRDGTMQSISLSGISFRAATP
jgi:hypothetical protein